MKIIKSVFTTFLILGLSLSSFCQDRQLDILNEVLEELKGKQQTTEIKVYKSLKEACSSGYINCDKSKSKVLGFDFQFANFNGTLSPKIVELEYLEYLNLEYNYISGQIPTGFSKLKNLDQLLFTGNFLEGPLPDDFKELDSNVLIDLAQNTISTQNRRWIDSYNIINQFNLDGCRSPDSIYLAFNEGSPVFDAVKPHEIDSTKLDSWVMPRFPGCEKKALNPKETEDCAKNEMLQFIYKNLRYPVIARENGIEGMAVVQFVILENGDIGKAVVVRDPGGRCGNASLWIVNRMNYISDKWIPGSDGGETVKVLYTLPVKFKLQ